MLKEDATQKVVRQHKPLGVVAAITPWNLPLLLLMIKVAPALLAGNTVVAKPAPTTPLTTLKFGELCARILPAGVVNVIVDQNDLGTALTSHPDVAKVAFTGSTATGKKVMASAAGTLKRLTLELGGNDAAIVLDDADPKEVAPKIYAAAMFNAGQVCIAIKRLYVHDSIYDAVCDELGRLARETVVGDGLEPGTQMGPIQNQAQFEKVKGFLEDARQNGTIVAGGGVLEREGYFVQPTIVRDISDNARLVREEQFGPVLPVLRYSDIDDAIDTRQRHGLRPGRLGLVVGPRAGVRSGGPDQLRHGLGEQASRCRAGHAVRRREAVRHRSRDGPGGTRGVHPGDHHQHGEMTTPVTPSLAHPAERGLGMSTFPIDRSKS